MNDLGKILDRVRKMLALAEHTDNEAEAALAAGRAAKLMEEYQLTEALVRLAIKIIGTSAGDFDSYWTEQPEADLSLKFETLYTRPMRIVNGERPAWQEGRCAT